MCASTRSPLPVLYCLLGLGLLAAQPPAALCQNEPAPRLAIADLEALFIQSAAGQDLQAKLKALQESVKSDLEAKMQEGRQLDQDLLGKSVDEQRAIRRQQEDIERDIRRLQEAAQREAGSLEKASRDAFNTAVQPIFAKLQADRGYDLILNKTPGVVIFASDSVEITQDILSLLNTGE